MSQTLSVADRLDIHDRIATLAWALDTADVDGFVDCFTADGELHWDAFEAPLAWRGATALRRFIEGLRDLPNSAGRQHLVTNVRVRATAEGALATAYVVVTLRQADGQVVPIVAGHYEDRLQRDQDAWRFTRHVIRDWAGPVLERFAGQDGSRVARPLPPPLAELARSGRA